MQGKIYKIPYDIKQGIRTYEVLNFTSEDNGACQFEFTMSDNVTAYNLTGTIVRLVAKAPNGVTIQQDCSITSATSGKASIVLLQSFFNVEGKYIAELQIYDSANQTLRLSLPQFTYRVQKSLMDDGTVQASNEFSILQNMIVNVSNASTTATQALNTANNAKTTADAAVTTINNQITNVNNAVAQVNNIVTEWEPLAAEIQDKIVIAETLPPVPRIKNTFYWKVNKYGQVEYVEDSTGKRYDFKPSNKFNMAYYDTNLGEYVNLDKFWDTLRTGKKYTVEFNQYNVSPSPLGTKKDDNVGLICEPSTNIVKGRNDYENIGLFMSIDVNGYVDENDDYHVTAIKGDGRFKNDGTNGDVWVMSMVGYQKRYSNENVWGISYSDTMHVGYEIIDEAVKPDGTIRPYLLHAKYIAGRNPVDGKLASISGVAPEFNNMSHNGQITEFKAKGIQYSGKTSHDDYYVQLMAWLKYATTNLETIMSGCINYNLQYRAKIAEAGVTRFIVTNAEASNLVIGSCVSVGDYGVGTINADRQITQNYNLANRVKITGKEPLADGTNTAILLDVITPFTTTLNSTITTYPWMSGACDNVLGTDGSPTSNTSGKEPFIINGIEIMVGGYEILQNLIIYNDNADTANFNIKVYACYDCKKYATTPTTDYDLISHRLAQTNQAWSYITKIGVDGNHPSVMIPVEVGGTSTTGFGDGLYTNTPTTGYRVWRSLGNLNNWAIYGLRYLNANNDLSNANWNILGRNSEINFLTCTTFPHLRMGLSLLF